MPRALAIAICLAACEDVGEDFVEDTRDVPLTHASRVASQDVLESDDLPIDLTAGTLAATLSAQATTPDETFPLVLSRLTRPDGTIAFQIPREGDPYELAQARRAPARPSIIDFTASLAFPETDRLDLLPPGTWQIRVAAPKGAARLHVLRRTGEPAATGTLDVNLFFAPGMGLTSGDEDLWKPAVDAMFDIYRQAGITLGELASFDLDEDDAADLSTCDVDSLGPDSDLRRLVRLSSVASNRRALNLFLVRSIEVEGLSGTLLGISPGVPYEVGVLGGPATGVVVGLAAHRSAGGAIDTAELGHTLAHESMHALGLFHTSEHSAEAHDLVSDTGECSLQADDRNRDGFLTSAECLGKDGNNVMFWLSHDLAVLTPGQAEVLRRSPAVRPAE